MIRYLRFIANVSNWWLHLAVKMGFIAKDPLLFRTRNGIRVEVPRRLFREFKEIFIEDCYTDGLTGKIPDHPTVVDIGANVGYFTLVAATALANRGQIVAFEPGKNAYARLTENLSLNPYGNIRSYPVAVSEVVSRANSSEPLVRDHNLRYRYFALEGFGLEPLTVAPLPMLASIAYAQETEPGIPAAL
mgnify:CR=1 FL=1